MHADLMLLYMQHTVCINRGPKKVFGHWRHT